MHQRITTDHGLVVDRLAEMSIRLIKVIAIVLV